jgi:hypothetical protein
VRVARAPFCMHVHCHTSTEKLPCLPTARVN